MNKIDTPFVQDKETAKKAIIAIGQEIIRQAEDVCQEINNVTSIKIEAEVLPCEHANVNITKNYAARFKEE